MGTVLDVIMRIIYTLKEKERVVYLIVVYVYCFGPLCSVLSSFSMIEILFDT